MGTDWNVYKGLAKFYFIVTIADAIVFDDCGVAYVACLNDVRHSEQKEKQDNRIIFFFIKANFMRTARPTNE